MEFCVPCLGTGERKKCTCHDVVDGRSARCQDFVKVPCIFCGGSGEKPTWESQRYVRPDIDNGFGVYK